jgi:hypothetical protein
MRLEHDPFQLNRDHASRPLILRNIERKTGFHTGSRPGHAFPDIAPGIDFAIDPFQSGD